MSDEIYYVYEHWRPDKDACFYVGKGKGARAWDMKRMRNRHHMAVTAKLKTLGLIVDVRIAASGLSSAAALALEIERIAFHGVGNLTNMTLGGDGMSNPTPATRAKISASQKKRFERPEELQRLRDRAKGRVTSLETRQRLSLAGKGRRRSPEVIERLRAAAKKRGVSEATRAAHKLALTGRKREPFTEQTIERMRAAAQALRARRVVCVDDGHRFDSLTEAATHYGVSLKAVHGVCSGRCHTTHGLRFAYIGAT